MIESFALLVAASVSTADIRPLLREQSFAGSLNGRETIQFVGQMGHGESGYEIYTYRGVHRAAAIDHGVNRLIVIRNRHTLVGTYAGSLPLDCKVRWMTVRCNAGNIEFTDKGPPRRAYFDGEYQDMDLGLKLKK